MENIEKLRVVFMGTPVFATAPLQQLIDSGYHIVAVVSQPDRPVGRKKELKPTPVKAVALQHGINVIQPNKLSEQPEVLLNYQPDLRNSKTRMYKCTWFIITKIPWWRTDATCHH